MQDAINFARNDLTDLSLDYLMFVRTVASHDPTAAQELCQFRNKRLLYVLTRLDQASLRRILTSINCIFGPAHIHEVIAALDAIAERNCPKKLVGAPDFFVDHYAREVERLQAQYWMLVRQEARSHRNAAGTTFDIMDHQVLRRITELPLHDLRILARFPIAMRISQSSGFELALSMEGAGTNLNAQRLQVAGMAAACYDDPRLDRQQGARS